MPGQHLHQFYFFHVLFVFDLRARTRQTDGQTDLRARRVMRPIGQPHRTIILVGAYARGPTKAENQRVYSADRHATDTTYQPASQSDSTQLKAGK